MGGTTKRVSHEHLRVEIQTLHQQGFKPAEIVQKLGCSRRTVWKWKNKNFVHDKKRPGRPRKVSPTTKRMIKNRLYKKTGSSLRNCARELNDSKRYKEKKKQINCVTVQKFVKTTKWGHTAYKLTKKTSHVTKIYR